ncbi:heavy-metal-associated domain-containing protein [Flavobacterium sp. W1B]|uniref:heavy-metal-associated domain-containing protein n=1 Tax=Flavobacterium sp. W1B TaxID=3394146 RepID=UPI0039BC9352
MKKVIIMMAVLFIGLSTQAQEKKNKNAKHNVTVNGNCEMCKKRIEKAAYAVSGVKSATWDINTHVLGLILNEQKTALLDVEKAVAKVGHDTKDVKATKEDYDNLHGCCMYERN